MTNWTDWIMCPYCGSEQAWPKGADDGSIGFYCEDCDESDWQ